MSVRGCIATIVLCAAFGGSAAARADAVTDWNAIAMRCVQVPVAPAPAPNRGGPPGLLDVALIQAAVHDAVQAIQGRFESYHYADPSRRGLGSEAAAAAAATYDLLVPLYGADDPCLVGVPDPAVTYAGDAGLETGSAAAAALAPLYRPVFATPLDPFLGGTGPGEWRPTPTAFAPGANAFMGQTAPFVLDRPSQFRPQPPPPLSSIAYFRDYEEVRRFGSKTGSERTIDQTELANFWSVNFITQWFGTLRAIANGHVADPGDKARLLALAAFAAADSQITVYDSKYHFNFWRPVTAIREGDADGNARTAGDPLWEPLVGTPPYQDYSSGANCLAGAITTVLQLYFGTDEFEYQVFTTSALATINPRNYTSFSQAQREMVDVRVWQGIHFRFADEIGMRQGSRVGHWTFHKALRPVRGRRN
jgi:PAP2 superfamily